MATQTQVGTGSTSGPLMIKSLHRIKREMPICIVLEPSLSAWGMAALLAGDPALAGLEQSKVTSCKAAMCGDPPSRSTKSAQGVCGPHIAFDCCVNFLCRVYCLLFGC